MRFFLRKALLLYSKNKTSNMTIRTCINVFGFSLFLSACQQNKTNSIVEVAPEIPLLTDTFDISKEADNVMAYKSASFDDFIYHFVSDTSFQKAQISFPLSITKHGKAGALDEAQWALNAPPRNLLSYAMLFTSKRHIDLLEKDTALCHAEVDYVFLNTDSVRKYTFNRMEGEWALQSIVIDRLARMKHGDFYKFFCQFATDTVYQYQHIRNPFGFKTEDDYSHETISGIVNAEAWPEYSPDLPTDVLACVLFEDKGQKTSKRYLVLPNLSAGLSTTLTFERARRGWRLAELEYN
jgi:hypothetical protein